jgi:ABC-type sulfate transport system permease component
MPALIAGDVHVVRRALGEFGATITFAGNLPGDHADHATRRVRGLPDRSRGFDRALGRFLMLLSFLLLVGLRATPPVWPEEGPTAPRLVSTISR